MRVLLTGGTGFLGGHVATLLAREGHETVAVVRAPSRAGSLRSAGARVCKASLETGEGLDEALDGVDAVIHCAGGGQVRSFEYETFHAQNVRTTQTVLDRALAVRGPSLKRFVHASSITAAPGSPARADGSGNAGDNPAGSLYGRSKREAEDAVLAARGKFPVTLVRLPALYGPGDTRWLTAFRAVRLRVIPVVSQRARLSLLYATDAARSLVLPLTREHPDGAVYSPDDGEALTHEELGRRIAEAVSVRAVPVRIPEGVLFGAARGAEWIGQRTGGKVFLTRDKVRDMLADTWRCDAGPMRDAIGFRAEVPFAEGARRTAQWFRSEGLL